MIFTKYNVFKQDADTTNRYYTRPTTSLLRVSINDDLS